MHKQGNLYKFPHLDEGGFHKESKEILYELIKNGVNLIDNYGKKIQVDMNQNNAFVQIESPTMLGMNGDILYGNTNNLCTQKSIGYKYKPYCQYNYEYGYVGEVPCWKCRDLNYFNADKEFVGFIADISYGYDNKHKIWFEVSHSNKISPMKYSFCKTNKIELYEIDSLNISADLKEVSLIKVDDLYCKINMIDNRVMLKFDKFLEQINTEGYKLSKEVKESLDCLGNGYSKIFFNIFKIDNELVEFTPNSNKRAKAIIEKYNIPSGRILTTEDNYLDMCRNIMNFQDAVRVVK